MYVWGPHKPFESASGPYGYGVPRGKRTHFLKWLRKKRREREKRYGRERRYGRLREREKRDGREPRYGCQREREKRYGSRA
jgi:hypothetical protein